MTRYTIVDRTACQPWAVCPSRLLLTVHTDEDDAVAAFQEYVADINPQPGVSARRMALVCRGEVLREWDSLSSNKSESAND